MMFPSFFLAGFEGSTGGHDRTVDSDYAELDRVGIHAASECVRWPLIDLGRGKYDFSSLDPFLEAANRHATGVIWDLFHYGYPQGLDPLSREFRLRFADYCFEVGRYIAERSDSNECWFTPVNEPSFLAFAGGEKGLFAPHLTGRGSDLKVALCRAAVAGIEALWVAAPGSRMLNFDPLCRVVAPPGRPELEEQVRSFNGDRVFEAWDMIAGRILPELGGSPRHLDVVGINYYWTNQWELEGEPQADGTPPPLADDDPRRWPLADLVRSVWVRYHHELIVSETAQVGENRGPWLRGVAADAGSLIKEGVPLRGVCLYPVLGMPQRHAPAERLICEDMLEALKESRALQAAIRSEARRRRAPAAVDRELLWHFLPGGRR